MLALLFTLAVSFAGPPQERRPWVLGQLGSAPIFIQCSPSTVNIDGEILTNVENPIVTALDAAGPGTTIYLDSGNYEPFTIGLGTRARTNSNTRGGRQGNPLVIEARGRVRIKNRGGDTLAIDQKSRNGWITFRGIEFEAGRRAGIMFFKQPENRAHTGFTFEDCDIIGNWDHLSRSGVTSKWGLWGHRMRDFSFVGLRGPARVMNIRLEHGFYIQNPLGNILIDNVTAHGLGRTFCQFTARESDGQPGRGPIVVRNCVVSDVGVAREDGYKGGAAFTIAGRLTGTLLFENNRYRAGFKDEWKRLRKSGQPYGTGAFVAWQGGENMPNGTLILRDNDFRFAKGCGDRPVVAIGGTQRVLIEGRNQFHSGGVNQALALDPVDLRDRPISPPNGRVVIAPETEFGGNVTSGTEELSRGQLKKLHVAQKSR